MSNTLNKTLTFKFKTSLNGRFECLPLNDPAIAPIHRMIATREREEIVVSKISRKSRSVGPKIAPHNPCVIKIVLIETEF